MWTQWRRWNWGLQQSPSRKSRLSPDHKLLLTASTWLYWLTCVSWPLAAGVAVWAAQHREQTDVCFHCVTVSFGFLIGSHVTENSSLTARAGEMKTKRRLRTVGRQERVRVIFVVLSDTVVSESGAFSLWWSAVRAYDCLVNNGQLV